MEGIGQAGAGGSADPMRVTPFQVSLSDETLADLARRLDHTRWPDSVPSTGWTYGADLDFLRRLVSYWKTGFDWRRQERVLNRFHHFKADAEGLDLHFVHERGAGETPLPLILTHGWPGSFVEFQKVLPLLTDPGAHGGDPADAFDVVVPSMPGYGFSAGLSVPGITNQKIADLWARLMTGLGYARFGAQGGDWGAGVATWLARRHPDRVLGIHLNYIPGSYRPHLDDGARPLSSAERRFLADQDAWVATEGAYGQVQATTPQTLAYGLNDSPAGLAAWIAEKFYRWGDCGGDIESRFTLDELLTNITIYWATETIHSSCRLYYESRSTPLSFGPGERLTVPCAVARFPKEMPSPPREWVERCYRVTRWTEMPRGGHFAAMEEPALLAEDIRAFFRPLRGR